MPEKLKSQLQEIGTTYELLLAFATQSLIVVSMVGFSIGTIPDLTDVARRRLDILNVTCVAYLLSSIWPAYGLLRTD